MDNTTQPRRIATVAERIARQLERDEALIAVAGRDDYAALLEAREITPAVVAAFADSVAACRASIARFEAQLVTQKTTTGAESDTYTALLNAFEEIQTAAAQKYAEDPALRPRLALYAVEQGIRRMPRAVLEQAAQNALIALQTDTLPGITSRKVAAFSQALSAWKSLDNAQSASVSTKRLTRKDITAQLVALGSQRRTIQRAADAQWPAHNAATRPIRAEFGLPKTRPLKV
jgi:hypothetical protein